MKQHGQVHGAWVLPYVPTPVALIIFWWLDREGLIEPRPYWQYLVLLVACGIANVAAVMGTKASSSQRLRIHARAAVAAITTTLIIYATGWGPMIVIGYTIGIADVIHAEGSRAWLPATLWTAAGVAAGQIAIEVGLAPSLVDAAIGNAVAVGNLICAAVVLRMFASAAQAAKEAHDELRRQANTDALTGLPNRAAITGAVESAVGRSGAVMFVDLDGFKEVNDRLGHERGDAVLVEAAARIATSIETTGTVGRLGGDEFLVVLPGLSHHELVAIADRILSALAAPWPEGGAISASIGIASASPHESADQLLDRADTAMYDAKSGGRARWRTAV